ncbi:MAG: flavin reductase family protein [Solirubrobacterales bacterium]|nr:flavin reductase family protein [Solirubrobacterales bacterium]
MAAALPGPSLPPHDGRFDDRLFRQTLGRFATGVVLLTASIDGVPLGLVVNSFSSVSLHPPLVSFCVTRASLTWRRMRPVRRFGINVLAAHHADYVRRAAPPGADRFTDIEYRHSAAGTPILADAVAFIECKLEDEHEAGDHLIALGRAEELLHNSGHEPLLFWNGSYGTFRRT